MKRMLFCVYNENADLIAIFLDEEDVELFCDDWDLTYTKHIVNDFGELFN